MTWKVINTGLQPAAWNMDFDKHLAEYAGAFDHLSILRLYGWNPHAISIGRNQSMDDFDLENVRREGIDIVRRPTGGRAILHAHELTYSVVTPCSSRNLKAIYRSINKGLLEGLRLLGIRAALTDEGASSHELYHQAVSIACFSASARSEIQYEGRKLIGSAQRRYGGIVLQHGSLLLNTQHRAIVNFLSPILGDSKSRLEDRLSRYTIDAETILDRSLSFDEAADAMVRGCARAWNVKFSSIEEPALSVAAPSPI